MHSVVSVEEGLPVVVGVDDAPGGLQIVDVAVAEAVYRGVPLKIVHAWPGRSGAAPRRRALLPDRADGDHLLVLAEQRARRAVEHLRVETELVDDSAAEALIQRSEGAGLLVMRHRDETALGHGWGATTAYVAHHSRCPLLVHHGSDERRGPVVVAASGRHTATMSCAFEAAARAACPLVAVHLWTPGESTADSGDRRREADERLTAAVDGGTGVWPEVTVNRLLIGEPEAAYTLERALRRGRLLVAGRGRKGWFVETLYDAGGTWLGGRRLCPVLLVPPGWAGPVEGRRTPVGTARS
jgi:nucleotide-binding universal stress UspA family protein